MESAGESLKHLFQKEFAKMVAVISKSYGLQHIEMAEDIVSDTFLTASESWGMNGMPANPTAWLYAVAKQKTLYHFRRKKVYDRKVLPAISHEQPKMEEAEPDFSPQHIRDSQLQMLFAICNPAIAAEAQIGLALRILCGFGIDEIAEAFLCGKDTINKRLFRAKEKLREQEIALEFPDEAALPARMENVLRIIYLLFNEGYYSKTSNRVLQQELCVEALRLGLMLTEFESTNLPETNALIALMCFHASRFEARLSSNDELILYEEQDDSKWDRNLILRGIHFLELSAKGERISSYHIEARIASWHCIKEDSPEKWEEILQLYDQLLLISFSPAAALNRIYALYKAKGREAALKAALELDLPHNHFYWLLLGELEAASHPERALQHLNKALSLARTAPEQQVIRDKIGKLSAG
jgi:RNA polymerase sigma-70 factor (ECF subfamily)